jgi:hypothetical protein
MLEHELVQRADAEQHGHAAVQAIGQAPPPGCSRWATTDLAGLVRTGLGDRPKQACRPRCRICGSLGEWLVRPSVPKITGAT